MDAVPKFPPPNYDDRGPGIVACAVVAMAVSTIVVILRFWSRVVAASLIFWWDDWAMLLTLAVSHAFLAVNIWWTTIGLGRHAWMVPLDKVTTNAAANITGLTLYSTCIYLIKISALLLYARIFKRSSRAFLRSLAVVGGLMTCWWIMCAIIPWTFCRPWRKNVDPFLPGYCKPHTSWFLASAFINAFLDLVVLLLPTPAIWRLQMNTSKKISVTFVFLLGYSSAFLSFARFIIIVRDPDMLAAEGPTADPSWNLVPLLYLSMLEAPLAITALCAPSINQLVARAVKYRSLSSLFTTNPHPTPVAQSNGSGSNRKRSRDTADSGSSGRGPHSEKYSPSGPWPLSDASSTTAIADRIHLDSDEEQRVDIPKGAIQISRDIRVARQ
ncbi:hypothetical protein HIM_05418 [Hirsutella minnesotensis 3608]|uniref:Rhodopsin domain-containing protein n=1 Tax=Hirsutella minnesotensis 3608 TaxID=1043627 RepID=A0A0F8A5F2_9HYPO|nr:hypothetical protein HIM_05418 [Hirsutella minnesotensis 3608]